MSSMTELTAPVKWAQRKDSLFVTVTLADVTDADIKIDKNSVTFRYTSSPYTYNPLNIDILYAIAARAAATTTPSAWFCSRSLMRRATSGR